MNRVPANSILGKLPPHLQQYIIPQKYDDYTSINQAVWRYVLTKNIKFLSKVAHHTYIEGLNLAGISIDAIPDMYGMNRILKKIGWAAAAVDGFIPPAAFMEFQAYNVLVIAVEIRTLEHIEYTPAPDIIHESAGHAPIIANPEYAEYLRRLGEIGCKAISSKYDWEVYNAVRDLSKIKEQENSDDSSILIAQQKVDLLQAKEVVPSEMSKIRNLQWWTVEYGLIGTLEDYKIYGAGLLSSIGESKWCLKDEVEKIPYSIAAAEAEFDITRPQPKLFVTPNFAFLSKVLEEFAENMAVRRGGVYGMKLLVDSESIGTIELSTGLQVTGVFTSFKSFGKKVSFIATSSLTSLSYRNKELIGHSKEIYKHGFISPIGKLKGINLAIEEMSPRDLEAYGIYEGEDLVLEYEGGIVVTGRVVTGTRNLKGKIILISLIDCIVKDSEKVLFESKNNMFHLAVGKKVVSAYAGLADVNSFKIPDQKLLPTIRVENKSKRMVDREAAYETVSKLRKKSDLIEEDLIVLQNLLDEFSDEWLLILEVFEIANRAGIQRILESSLEILTSIKIKFPDKKDLIEEGILMYS